MALKKQRIYKGQSYEYWGWVVYGQNKVDNTTTFAMGAFKDKATREADVTNEMTDLREVRVYAGLLTLEQCYLAFKRSNAAHVIIQAATHDEPEISENKPNTNWFADAGDI